MSTQSCWRTQLPPMRVFAFDSFLRNWLRIVGGSGPIRAGLRPDHITVKQEVGCSNHLGRTITTFRMSNL